MLRLLECRLAGDQVTHFSASARREEYIVAFLHKFVINGPLPRRALSLESVEYVSHGRSARGHSHYRRIHNMSRRCVIVLVILLFPVLCCIMSSGVVPVTFTFGILAVTAVLPRS